jgi:hypothetical protein
VISFESFKVLPEGYDAGARVIEVYILSKGSILTPHIDLSCPCLEKISNRNWISFDKT